MKQPTIALSLGDPSGIGPEIIAELSHDEALLEAVQLVCFGDRGALLAGYEAKRLIPRFVEGRPHPGQMTLRIVTSMPPKARIFGKPGAGVGRAQLAYFDAAIQSLLRGEANAICTAPITKSIVDREAGPFSGHTGHLAASVGGRAVMMLASDVLRVLLLTEHIPLSEVSKRVTRESLLEVLQISALGLRNDLGIARPRIAVAALNPHAGEEGHIGREELDTIIPAIKEAQTLLQAVADIYEPAPADSLFTTKARAKYDAVLCLYHDQGLIPLKALSARSAVNVTLGLSVVRTSPDHGTAYDIAGQGVADASSLKRALLLAAEIVACRESAQPVGR